jgi:nitrogen-specific signal transduction histidine kinase/ActR/RegA family two-component response regulator
VIRDISERKNMEEELRQAHKMEAVGRLAGGIAHDFNNLLTIINGYGELVVGQLRADDPLREPVTQIKKAGERAAELTQQLLAFSRKQIMQPKPLDLSQVVREHEEMLRRLVGEDVEIVTQLSPSLGPVMADQGQIHQVLLNLAGNARDAMPAGGVLTIETAEVEVDASSAADQSEVPPGSYILLSITDSGTGMDEETLQHIFEPFYTTKDVGAGTGLGLATVHGIVTQSGGWIRVQSKPGRGTTLRIYLPRIAPVAHTRSVPVEPQAAVDGSETVLVVEDLAELRKLAVAVLGNCGYKVLHAGDGRDALAVADGHAGPIHLLLTDVVMPGMTGQLLAQQLRTRRPETKVLYMSGYTGDRMSPGGALEADVAFLQKPFTPAQLLARVRRILSQADTRGPEA